MTLKDDLGMLIQSCQLPIMEAGVDAVEARLVVVQEIPQKSELRFFTVRDDKRALVSSDAALALLRAHYPRKPLLDLTQIELLAEVSVLRSEVERLQPVYETAKAWRAGTNADMQQRLVAAVDAAHPHESVDRSCHR